MGINDNDLNSLQKFFGEVKMKDVMSTTIPHVYEDEDFSRVHKVFQETKTYYCIVLKRDETLSGLISHKYFYKTHAPRKFIEREAQYNVELLSDPDILLDEGGFYSQQTLDSYILNKVMLKDPFTLEPDDPLQLAILKMAEKNISCIPIITKKRLVSGVTTHTDVIRFLGKVLTLKKS